MNFIELTRAVFSIVHKNDPHRESKLLQLRNWCSTFFILFKEDGPIRLSFVLGVLSDEDCWERTDTIYRIELNRRMVAKMLVRLPTWKGRTNPLKAIERFRVASWCCLEKDIVLAFEHCKREYKIINDSSDGLKELILILSTSTTCANRLTEYWSHVISGYVPELQLKGKHLYEYGLYLAVHKMDRKLQKSDDEETELNKKNYRGYLEAVEFFWNKIESLPEKELRSHQKFEIFVKTAVRAAMTDCANNPEILEFCLAQLSLDLFPEFLQKASSVRSFSAISRVQMNRPDLVPKIFNSLYFLVVMDCFKPVFAVLEKATTDQLQTFLNTDQCNKIHNSLLDRGYQNIFGTFISYFSDIIFEEQSTRG